MVRHMSKPATTTVEQLARRGWLFVLELRAPVPVPLQRQPMLLAILPLIQVATAPAVQMRPPKRFKFQALRRRHSWHDRPPSSQTCSWREDRIPEARNKGVTAGRLPEN
jgi:hypothetical protein